MTKKILALILVLSLMFILIYRTSGDKIEVDPHEGMVEVNVGSEYHWITPADGISVSTLDPEDFSYDGNIMTYTGDEFDTVFGIDVSFYQGDIDWEAVADFGVEFAMIRCGYRGYTEGGIYEDETFRQNIEGALAAGIEVGVYFFSQAIDCVEAIEEALFVLDVIEDYDITMPIAFDWEPQENSRTTGVVTSESLALSAKSFCDTIKAAGYEPCLYLYRYIAYYDYDLSYFPDEYAIWIGAPGESPDFYYEHEIWQYSFTGTVDGIVGDVDMNIYFK